VALVTSEKAALRLESPRAALHTLLIITKILMNLIMSWKFDANRQNKIEGND
jgi:hypothetical protein